MAPLSPSLVALVRALLVLGALLAAEPLRAQPVDKSAIHAAFTLNIARFVAWPADAFRGPEAPLVIGTAEDDPINPALDRASATERIHGRAVRTIRLRTLEDLTRCHLLFMSAATPRPDSILSRVKGLPILTIGESPGFLELGGHVAFVPRGSRVALRINPDHLRESGLEARARLLRLAEIDAP